MIIFVHVSSCIRLGLKLNLMSIARSCHSVLKIVISTVRLKSIYKNLRQKELYMTRYKSIIINCPFGKQQKLDTKTKLFKIK